MYIKNVKIGSATNSSSYHSTVTFSQELFDKYKNKLDKVHNINGLQYKGVVLATVRSLEELNLVSSQSHANGSSSAHLEFNVFSELIASGRYCDLDPDPDTVLTTNWSKPFNYLLGLETGLADGKDLILAKKDIYGDEFIIKYGCNSPKPDSYETEPAFRLIYSKDLYDTYYTKGNTPIKLGNCYYPAVFIAHQINIDALKKIVSQTEADDYVRNFMTRILDASRGAAKYYFDMMKDCVSVSDWDLANIFEQYFLNIELSTTEPYYIRNKQLYAGDHIQIITRYIAE